MRRRLFMKTGANLLAAEAVASAVARGSEADTLAIGRTSRLFNASGSGTETQVQDVIFVDNVFYCLYRNLKTRASAIAVSTPAGNILQALDLPKGAYARLGIRSKTLLISAISYFTTPTAATPNCILEVDGGNIRIRESGSEGRFAFAGHSRMLLLKPGAAQLWTVNDAETSKIDVGNINLRSVDVNIDVLLDGRISIIPRDGSTLGLISGSSYVERPIVSPQIKAAAAYYQAKAASTTATPAIIPTTGVDNAGHVVGLVFPSPQNAVSSTSFDPTTGISSDWYQFEFPPRGNSPTPMPLKIFMNQGEIGISFADGRIAWYEV